MRGALRRLAIAAAVACFGVALVVAVRGRLDIFLGTHRLAIRGTTIPGVVGWMLAAVAASGMPSERRAHVADRITRWIRTRAPWLARGLTLGVLVVGIWQGAFVAAGADLYGYVSQADLWAAGNPVQHLPIVALDAPWPDADWSFAPLGYRPGTVHGTIVPTYPIGLPLQMAALSRAFGAWAVFAVVPLLGAMSVWMAFDLARRLGSAEVAVLAALLVACNPTFLFQLVQPMSDVPVAAWWIAAVALGRGTTMTSALASGVAASLAILTRPNTALLVVPLLTHVAGSGERGKARGVRAAACAGAVAPGIAVTAWSNTTLYGSATGSGYGALGAIFDASRIAPMTVRYVSTVGHTYTPLLFSAVVVCAAALVRRDSMPVELRRFCWTACAFAACLLASYAAYSVFDLRFLLPAVVLLMVASTMALGTWAGRLPRPVRVLTFGMAATLIPLGFVHQATHAEAWRLNDMFSRRYIESGRRARALPRRAVLISILESGSLRYYGDRLTLRFDWMPAASLDDIVAYLTERGHAVYFAGAAQELAQFRDTFAGSHVVESLRPEADDSRLATDVRFVPLVPPR